MKTFRKAVLFGLLFSVCSQAEALAQENVSFFQKIKNFFSGSSSTTEQSETIPEDKSDTMQAIPAPAPVKKKAVADFSEKTIGDRDAPLKINIFTSLTCPHCSGVHTQLLPYLKERYVDTKEALIVLNDFPLDERAMTASLIAHCLTGDAYFAFVDTLFENQRHWVVAPDEKEALMPYVKLAGLSEEETVSCAMDKAASKEMIRQRNLAIMRYKIHATPTLVLQMGKEKERIEGAPSRADIDKTIEKLKKAYYGSQEDFAEKQDEKAVPPSSGE